MGRKPKLTYVEAAALVHEHGSMKAASRETGYTFGAIQRAMRRGAPTAQAGETIGKELRGYVKPREERERELPSGDDVKRYILTCAQNNTKLHDGAWANLMALAEHYGAEVLVSRFTYDKSSYGAGATKPDTEVEHEELWYDPRIASYVCDERVQLAPGLVWCGELNILPTASRPLSGLEAYTGRRSSIIPHVKIAMESIASGKYEATKFIYTTGTVTLRNYIQKKDGQRAEFHHCYGGLLVEVDSHGSWWCRQLNADSEGTIFDLNVRAADGKIDPAPWRVEAISWGDIHAQRLDVEVERLGWGLERVWPDDAERVDGDSAWTYRLSGTLRPSMVDELDPKYQFMHDLIDFESRNHHHVKDPHERFKLHVTGRESVEAEVRQATAFLYASQRPSAQTVVVDSNHDEALTRWLREADYRQDPLNARYFLWLQYNLYNAIAKRDDGYHVLEQAMLGFAEDFRERSAGITWPFTFLHEDESFVICRDKNGGIEMGMHGHLGVNGARGSARAFARMGRKAVTGHTHSAGIVDGVYTGGVSGSLDLGYNRGPSSWSHSHVVVYQNGKRAIITMWNAKWRA